MRIWGRIAAVIVVGLLVGGCASQVVAGTGGPGGTPTAGPGGPPTTSPGTTPSTSQQPTSTTIEVPDCPVGTAVPAFEVPPTTPTGSPLITVTQGTNAWIASDLTQPYDIAIYPDGTAIRTEELGTMSDPLPELTIGWIDTCRLAAAVAQFAELSEADLGEAGVTDQGTTTVTVSDPAGEYVIDVYALGVGDDVVSDDQRAAREQLAGLITDLRDAMAETATWTPDRVRVSLVGNPVNPEDVTTWPLSGTIADALDVPGRLPCGVFAGDDAAAIIAALGSGVAGSSWSDGTQTVVLAVGALVPGQECTR